MAEKPIKGTIAMAAALNHRELESLSRELHQLLTSVQEEVRAELHEIEHLRQLLTSTPSGRPEAEREIAARLELEHLRHHLDLIAQCNEALERINRGSYGRCLRCEEVIELNRLRADPLTDYCLNCRE
jgi:RNA polymerase-binding protein DksA